MIALNFLLFGPVIQVLCLGPRLNVGPKRKFVIIYIYINIYLYYLCLYNLEMFYKISLVVIYWQNCLPVLYTKMI